MTDLTYAIIKPDGYRHRRAIKKMIRDNGLVIVDDIDPYRFQTDVAKRHYEVHKEKPFYSGLVEMMTSGYTVQMIIAGSNALKKLRDVVGATNPKLASPHTIRGRFGTELPYNVIHASDSEQSVLREIALNYPIDQIPGFAWDILKDYSAQYCTETGVWVVK